ncbi:hypothetical protein DTL42_03165 [Bremerella cremea]|uniref:Uncharacterized protein n=1 Tax=Bremerella cremea TaxID=1031537 RepID=A0A368KUQ6_9BACT|nr:hypothetical protein [Bremerella cremea]RCS54163.1 hypothetical protein DTL42_03165 [Bremerella cremea]
MTEPEQLASLNARLAECLANHREKTKLWKMLRETKQQLAQATHAQQEANQVLEQAQADVNALEGLSLTALFHAVLGVKEERLEEQRQAIVSAKLKRDQAQATIHDLAPECKQIEQQMNTLGDVDRQHQALLREKSEYLQQSGHETAQRIIGLTEEIANYTANEKELYQAIRAGKLAQASLDDVRQSLNSAANFGTFDMLGGGMLTTMAKHSRLDTARRSAEQTQKHLLCFQKELGDVNQRLQMSLEIGSFTTFADYFFDGLIADWIVQSKINHARQQCDDTRAAVRKVIENCQLFLHKSQRAKHKLETEKQQLIEQAC